MRGYSLSGEPSASYYRVSVKRKTHGAASAYVDDVLQVGDIVHASAPRGSFILRQGDTPVVLLSAGIGVTPVLAMLHTLAAESSTREIWRLYGTRNGREHPFAEETRGLLSALPRGHSHICYSSPDPEDRPNVDFDAPGRLNMRVLEELNLPRNGDFYICGPSTFMRDLTAGLAALGVAPDRIHTEIFSAGPSITPALPLRRTGRHICRQDLPAQDRWFRSPEVVSMSAGRHRSRACSSWPRLVTRPCVGRVERRSATPARSYS
jgi:ferredoxin-NADP reductase